MLKVVKPFRKFASCHFDMGGQNRRYSIGRLGVVMYIHNGRRANVWYWDEII